MIRAFKRKIHLLDEHTLEVLRKSGLSIIVKVLGMMTWVGSSMILGRTLGVEGFGIINLSNNIITILLLFCMLGHPQLLMKEIAIGFSQEKWQRIRDYMKSAYILNGAVALIISVLFITLAPYISLHIFREPALTKPLIIAMAVVAPEVFSRIFSSALTGYRKIWQSNLVDNTLSSGVTFVIILILYVTKHHIDVVIAAYVYAIGRLTVALVMGVYWEKIKSYTHQWKGKSSISIMELMKKSYPFIWFGSLGTLTAILDGVLVGWLANAEQVGLYSVALRLAMLTSFILAVTNSTVGPKLAAMYAAKELHAMTKMVHRISFILISAGAFILSIFVFGGHFILSFWGHGFSQAYILLVLLSTGQFVNIATGPAGFLLIMCGQERIHAYISSFSLIFNVLLNYYLITNYGALGAAVATCLTVSVENIIKVVFAWKYVGVLTIPLNIISKYGK